MVQGFKDKNKKFHPIKKTRKARIFNANGSLVPKSGILLTKKISVKTPEGQAVISGIGKSLNEQPTKIQNVVKQIIIKKKQPSEDFIAKVETEKGIATFNEKKGLQEEDYHGLGEHEFQHLWFNNVEGTDSQKIKKFIEQGNRINPFAQDLEIIRGLIRDAFIKGDFEQLADLRLEYPDEINSLIREIEIRDKLGLKSDVIDQEEFEKAKRLVKKLHTV